MTQNELKGQRKTMWPKEYKNYKVDHSLIKNPVESGRGIIGCEMHEINGWGNTFHSSKTSKKKSF